MELPDDIQEQVEVLAEQGNDLLDNENFQEALNVWRQAFQLLPEPRNDWEAALWLHASMADAYYSMADYQGARDAAYDALNAPDGHQNPYVHYMLGKALVRLDDDKAVEALLRAYMLDGNDIFDSDEEEGAEVFAILQQRGLV